jgi:uncharacterized membrane protein YfcA
LDHLLQSYLIICPLVFLGGFVDSVAGGGGLITLPAYMLAGIPVHMSMGTNKIAASLGGLTATAQYIRSGKINFSIAIPAAIFAYLGGQVGAGTAMHLSEDFLNVMMLVVLPVVAVFLTLKKDLGSDTAIPREMSKLRQYAIAAFIGFFTGMYDGMVGPGTGTFMIMLFSAFLSVDLITSSSLSRDHSAHLARRIRNFLQSTGFLLTLVGIFVLGTAYVLVVARIRYLRMVKQIMEVPDEVDVPPSSGPKLPSRSDKERH